MTKEEREYREKVIQDDMVAIENRVRHAFNQGYNLGQMKSGKQEPKQGHWYIDERPESNREIICSNCEKPIFEYHKLDFDYRPKYCPNCGSKNE